MLHYTSIPVRAVAKRTATALILSLGALIPAQRSAAQAPRPALSLGELYRDVQRLSPRLAAARALAQAADARIPASKLPPDPQLQLGLMNYAVPGLRPMDPLGMTQLQLMQMLPLAGKLSLSGRVSTAHASAQYERAAEVGWELRSQAAMAFYELYATEQRLVVARETVRLLQDLQHTSEAMYRVGEGRQADVLRAQVEIARMTEDTLRMQTMRLTTRARLNVLLDRALDAAIADPLLPILPDSVPTLETLAAHAAQNRPMVKAAVREVDAADASAQLARREIWPDVTLGIQYGQRRSEMGIERMGSLMVAASLPVFASRRQLRMREETAAMRAMAQADLAVMRADTRGRVAEAYANLTRARHLIRLYRNTVLPQAEATVASSLAAYRVGSVDFMTALDSRMKVNEYRQELFALEAEEGTAWAELEMLVGRELFDPAVTRRTVDAQGDGR